MLTSQRKSDSQVAATTRGAIAGICMGGLPHAPDIKTTEMAKACIDQVMEMFN